MQIVVPQVSAKLTRALLACGVIAGPIYVTEGSIEMLAPGSTSGITRSAC
jgi:hypothetical protein